MSHLRYEELQKSSDIKAEIMQVADLMNTMQNVASAALCDSHIKYSVETQALEHGKDQLRGEVRINEAASAEMARKRDKSIACLRKVYTAVRKELDTRATWNSQTEMVRAQKPNTQT